MGLEFSAKAKQELDRIFGWETASSLYPEAGKPGELVAAIEPAEVDWNVARERFRQRQYERCAAGLRESADWQRAVASLDQALARPGIALS